MKLYHATGTLIGILIASVLIVGVILNNHFIPDSPFFKGASIIPSALIAVVSFGIFGGLFAESCHRS